MKLPDTHSVTSAAPVIFVGVALLALCFWPIPLPNQEIVKMILAGLLGALATANRKPDDSK